MLKFSDFSVKFDSKTCDICVQDKHTRESFPLSYNKASVVFELIHCDLLILKITQWICSKGEDKFTYLSQDKINKDSIRKEE